MQGIAGFFQSLGRLLLLPFKLVFAVCAAVGRAMRIAGVKGVVCFVLGLALGLLFAPAKGRDLRAKLQRVLGRGAGLSDAELAEKVGFELGHAPRTWHLPQPDVAVVEGRVQLRGRVPHDTAREELVRVATAIPGVGAVDDLLDVEAATS